MDDEQYVINYDDLDEAVCWRLLSGGGVGRVAFVYDGEPVILPVNFGVTSENVVFRTGDRSMLHELGNGTLVAFEADETDHVAQSGWDVLLKGHLWDVEDESTVPHLDELAVRPWVPGSHDRWMRIVPIAVTGRMITRHRVSHDGRPSYMPPD